MTYAELIRRQGKHVMSFLFRTVASPPIIPSYSPQTGLDLDLRCAYQSLPSSGRSLIECLLGCFEIQLQPLVTTVSHPRRYKTLYKIQMLQSGSQTQISMMHQTLSSMDQYRRAQTRGKTLAFGVCHMLDVQRNSNPAVRSPGSKVNDAHHRTPIVAARSSR